jgi:hypothetical protein
VGSVALLYLNLVKFPRIHRMFLPSMMLPSISSAPAAW